MGRYDTLKQTINICKREGIQWKKCPVWKNVDMDRIKRDKVYRDEVASYIMFWTGRNDLFPYKGGTTPEHLAAHDGEWGSMQEGKLNEIGDTPAGQWMLGRLAGRQRNREIGQGDRKSPISYKSGKIKNTTVDAYDYADKDGFGGDYDSHEAFGRGYDTENGEWANDYDSNGNYDHSQHLDNERQNAENMGYGYAMKAMINAQQRKNPQTVKLSESQLRNMIKETVNRVIDLRDPDDYIPFDEYEQHEQAAKERMKAKASELQAYANEQLRGTDISLEVKYRETEHLGVKDCCIDIFSVTNGKKKFVQLFTDGDKAENKVKEIVDSIMNTNTNNTVKLSESHLRGMIAECVKKVLKEYTYGVEGELVPDYGDFYHGEPYVAGDNPFADKDNKYTDKGRDKELSIEALEALWSKITELQQVAYKVRTDEGGKYLLRVFPQECQRLKELFPSFCIGEPIFAMQQAIDVLNGLRDKLKNEKYQ